MSDQGKALVSEGNKLHLNVTSDDICRIMLPGYWFHHLVSAIFYFLELWQQLCHIIVKQGNSGTSLLIQTLAPLQISFVTVGNICDVCDDFMLQLVHLQNWNINGNYL